MLIEFKNRETTAKNGQLPKEVLIFTDFNMKKEELDLIYDAVRYEIGRCSKNNFYDVIDVYINLMIDIEDILEEISKKYKNTSDYIFQMPVHLLEVSFLLKALKDYGIMLDKDDKEDVNKVLELNQLADKVSLMAKNNYKPLKKSLLKYDKYTRLQLLRNLWNKLYELTDI